MVAAVQFPPVRISATPGPALAHYWQVHYKYYTFCVWSIQPIGLQVHLRLILGEQLTDYSYVKKLSICVFWWQLGLFYPPAACLPRAGQHLSVIGKSLGLQKHCTVVYTWEELDINEVTSYRWLVLIYGYQYIHFDYVWWHEFMWLLQSNCRRSQYLPGVDQQWPITGKSIALNPFCVMPM